MSKNKTPLMYSYKLHCCKFNVVIIIISLTFLQLKYINFLLFNIVFIFVFEEKKKGLTV